MTYWGLRNYRIPSVVWGGDAGCAHEWGEEGLRRRTGGTDRSSLAYCSKCGAWRGDLGLEPTPWAWVEHIVEVFDLVRQLLADDGTLVSGAVRWRTGSSGNKGNGAAAEVVCRLPWAAAMALRAAGWYLRSDIIWHKTNPMPESCKDRPTKAHEYLLLLAKDGTRPLWYQAKDTGEWSRAPELAETITTHSNTMSPGREPARMQGSTSAAGNAAVCASLR